MIVDATLSNLKPGDKVPPKDLAMKVQGMFLEVMLKTMEDSVESEDGFFAKNATSEIYRGMFREQVASEMSRQLKSTLGDKLERSFEKASQDVSKSG